MASESRPPYPPFTEETAKTKVKAAQDAWNTKSVFFECHVSQNFKKLE